MGAVVRKKRRLKKLIKKFGFTDIDFYDFWIGPFEKHMQDAKKSYFKGNHNPKFRVDFHKLITKQEVIENNYGRVVPYE